MRRFSSRVGWESFLDEILVSCPRCEATALIRPVSPGEASAAPGVYRVACAHCGFNKDGTGAGLAPQGNAELVREACFELPLRLQTRCAGQVLWAFNHRHLAFLEAFVQASLRERTRHPAWGWSNGALVSRLPRWLKAARHRDAVRKALASLRERR